MLARCSRCAQTFETDRYGAQFCPHCGAQVMVATPPGAGASTPPPSAGPTPGAGGNSGPLPQPGPVAEHEAPMDAPERHGGFAQAFLATWKQSVLEPTTFFTGLKAEPVGGALIFAAICIAIGNFVAGLYQLVQSSLQANQTAELMKQLGALPAQNAAMLKSAMNFATGMSATAPLTYPVTAVLGFLVGTVFLHGALWVVGGNKRGFTATFRALCYAQGPSLIAIVPVCGSLVAALWTLVLAVSGLAAIHRIEIGRVIGAYALLLFISCCACCLPLSIAGTMAGISAAGAIKDVPSLELPPMDGLPDDSNGPGIPVRDAPSDGDEAK